MSHFGGLAQLEGVYGFEQTRAEITPYEHLGLGGSRVRCDGHESCGPLDMQILGFKVGGIAQ